MTHQAVGSPEASNPSLAAVDPRVAELIVQEARRQATKLQLIPSENYASRAVMQACGSVLTNKYSEGYPGRRYYEGQQVVDQVEGEAHAGHDIRTGPSSISTDNRLPVASRVPLPVVTLRAPPCRG
jgi:hypothetical protein